MHEHACVKRTAAARVLALLAACTFVACGLLACVDARDADHIGTATFSQGIAALDSDYDAPVGAAGSSPSPSGPSGAAPVAGQSAPPSSGGPAAGTTPPPASAGNAAASGAGGMAGAMMTAGLGGAGSGGSAGGTAGNTSAGAGGGGAAGGNAGAGTAGEGMAGAPAPSGGATAGTLKITFTSVNQRGRYAPANVGAVWIETGDGKFIKTIKRWGGIRATHLTKWAAVSGGWPSLFRAGNAEDQMDAISGATARSHGVQDLSWDMKDLKGMVVPDGKYKVGIEVTEDNRVPGANVAIEFSKGSTASMVKPPDAPPYSGLTITFTP